MHGRTPARTRGARAYTGAGARSYGRAWRAGAARTPARDSISGKEGAARRARHDRGTDGPVVRY